MASYKQAFMDFMDQEGIKYHDLEGDHVRVSYNVKNGTFDVNLFFDEDGEGLVALRCWNIGEFGEDKYSEALITCNEMNVKYRWVKFYLDSDREVCASIDAVIDMETVGEECMQLIGRMVSICDEVYPAFMRVKWN